MRGLVGRAGTTSAFDLARWAPSDATAEFVEHFWSVSWDLRGQEPVDSAVITFPSLHLTHEWGSDGPRHGFSLPNTLVHGVVERVFRTTISERGAVVGARFRPGGFTARFDRDAALLTGRVQPADDELFGRPKPVPDQHCLEPAIDALMIRLVHQLGHLWPSLRAGRHRSVSCNVQRRAASTALANGLLAAAMHVRIRGGVTGAAGAKDEEVRLHARLNPSLTTAGRRSIWSSRSRLSTATASAKSARRNESQSRSIKR